MNTNDLRNLFVEARKLAEQTISIRDQYAGLREAATKKGIDWSQLKALAVADAADEDAEEDKRLRKLIAKADFAAAYADILKLRKDERKTLIRSSSESAVSSLPVDSGEPAPAIASSKQHPRGAGSQTQSAVSSASFPDSGEPAALNNPPGLSGAGSLPSDDIRDQSFYRGPVQVV